jgi:S-adenosylmethionine:tRNA ribosyltransferase-isomerase
MSSSEILSTSMFDYDLPEELIAQYPAARRGDDRLLAVDRASGSFEIMPFSRITSFLHPGDAMIYNDTKVLKSRMYGVKESPGSARFELLFTAPAPETDNHWFSLLKPGKRATPGTRINILDKSSGEIAGTVTVVRPHTDGNYELDLGEFSAVELFRRAGHVPLPPYVRHEDTEVDARRYQTVYAHVPGAVAAPTAGLHFTDEILAGIREMGVASAPVTLHVGPGTFRPVTVEDPTQHQMHTEYCELPSAACELVNSTRSKGGKIMAVGTTTVRTLESFAGKHLPLEPGSMETNIFLYPPYKPKVCDMLLTNFHMPKSTLMMLVSCFMPREMLLAAYEYAKENRMRFASYGDAMLII